MNKREAFLRGLKREELSNANRVFPPDIGLTPPKIAEFNSMKTGMTIEEYFGLFHRLVAIRMQKTYEGDGYYLFKGQNMPDKYEVDTYGTGSSRGSEACMHMVHYHPPMIGERSLEEIQNYPLPQIPENEFERVRKAVKENRDKELAAVGALEQTIWERAWLIRGMEDLMVDMMMEDPKAELLFYRITELSCAAAALYAEAGVDMIALGDDIGMQTTPMMDPKLWYRYLQPQLAKVVKAAKDVNPNVIIFYHSCGHVTPFIDGLIEAGVEVLNPLQPESMDVMKLYSTYSDRLSFWGSIGTQTTMPFGSADDVRSTVLDRVRMSERNRGIIISPTHIIEPEVPWDNLHAYIDIMNKLNSL